MELFIRLFGKTAGQLIAFLVILCTGLFKPFIAIYYKLKEAMSEPNSPALHAKKVAKCQDQVLEWIRNGRKTKLCTARPMWRRTSIELTNYKKSMTGIKLDDLNDIIEVDTKQRVVRVEPMINMGELSSRLHKLGWRVPVIPEYFLLTVGGLIAGAGLETSSHKYGLFCHTCTAFEILLADGSIVNCSKEKNPDLFHAIPMSLGTLGFLMSATIKIIPSKKYVKLEYIPKTSLDGMVSEFSNQIHKTANNEFVEGIAYGLNKGVIMVGNLVDEHEIESEKVNPFLRWYKPGFNVHVASILEKGSRVIEYVPLIDYYHRHDRNIFWMLDAAAPFTQTTWFRYLFGWILPINVIYVKLLIPERFRSLLHTYTFGNDYVIPIEKLKEILKLSHKETEVYPIWLCGWLDQAWPGMTNADGKMFVDVGIYGYTKCRDWRKTLATFEEFVLKVKGYYGTYSDTVMTREQFKQMFDHSIYYKVKKQLGCTDVFPDVYDKIAHAPMK